MDPRDLPLAEPNRQTPRREELFGAPAADHDFDPAGFDPVDLEDQSFAAEARPRSPVKRGFGRLRDFARRVGERRRRARQTRREKALVPAASIAGRALVTVIAIMTFLAALTAGAAMLIADASSSWRSEVAREMTIQIRPTQGRDIEADLRKTAELARRTPGIASARPFSRDESEELLEPWLGSNLDLSELPVPRLVALTLRPGAHLDATALARAVADAVPGATLDDHHRWMRRLALMANSVVVAAALIFALVLAAMILAVAFATRGAMAGNREIIEVLHFVGAADEYVARQFQRHFFRLGLRGGLIGGVSAIVAFYLTSTLVEFLRATPGGDQMEALFGGFSLGSEVYVAILAIAFGAALATGIVSRFIVLRHLRDLS
ncbi:cell division protein FtsX [Methylocella sp.]|uniref:cell division protein FtsX n=1 Tax=Methylocella sp. TaxID=1978226 RepID=UPI003784C134